MCYQSKDEKIAISVELHLRHEYGLDAMVGTEGVIFSLSIKENKTYWASRSGVCIPSRGPPVDGAIGREFTRLVLATLICLENVLLGIGKGIDAILSDLFGCWWMSYDQARRHPNIGIPCDICQRKYHCVKEI